MLKVHFVHTVNYDHPVCGSKVAKEISSRMDEVTCENCKRIMVANNSDHKQIGDDGLQRFKDSMQSLTSPLLSATCKHGTPSTATHCGSCDIETCLAAGVEVPGVFSFTKNLIVTKRPIVFCWESYWGKWSRLLKPQYDAKRPGEPQGYVELDLEPVNGWSFSQDQIRNCTRINIRVHGTSRDRSKMHLRPGEDTIYRWRYFETHELPKRVRDSLVDNVGEAKANFMLQHDFMADIDWEAGRKLCNGGFPYLLARKG